MDTIEQALPLIGVEYARQDAATVTDEDRKLWTDFARHNQERAAYIASRILVTETGNPEPYATSYDQSADIARGRFVVSNTHCEHPVWTVSDNVAFRIVHDIDGHHAIGAGFHRQGEVDVYRYSITHTPERFHRCLFVESIGQLAYAVAAGDFGPQKVYRSLYFGKVV